MSLYGINSYTSNLYSYLSTKSNNKNSFSSASNTDLNSLMKKVDQVRSQQYRKTMLEEYKKAFSGEETGSVASETALASTATQLSKSSSELAAGSEELFSDPEKLSKSVETFVKDYNSTIDALKSSNSVDALRKGVFMTNTAKAYSRSLARIGLSVGSDNKLTLDKDALAAADKNTVKSLMSGNYSFTNKTADKAGSINRAASLKAQVTYTSEGLLNYYTSQNNSFFDGLI